MTRKIFIASTLFFWLAVGMLATTTLLWVSADSAMADAPLKTISPAELAKHAKPDDCWLVIRGGVYNMSDYIVQHPGGPGAIEDLCGKEATKAYNTKNADRAHSPYADEALANYKVGKFGKK